MLFFSAFMMVACDGGLEKTDTNKAEINPSGQKKSGLNAPDKAPNLDVDSDLSDSDFELQAKYLKRAMQDTQYTALIEITSVESIDLADSDTSDDFAEQKLIFVAKVHDTFRGTETKNLTYIMYIETGESIEYPQGPFIINLCHSNEGFYWPGMGTHFSADKKLIELAKTEMKSLDKNQVNFGYCEEY